MATDRRRINGPANPTPPVYEQLSQLQCHKPKLTRARTPGIPRKIFLALSPLSSSNGSCFLESENTRIFVSVHGPRQSSIYSPEAKLSCWEDKSLSNRILSAVGPSVMVNLYPKTHIDIFVIILSWDGERAALCNAITAASLAISDAGIECMDLTVGMSCGRPASQDTINNTGYYIDLTKEEEEGCTSWTVVGYMASRDEITYIESCGSPSIDVTLEAARAVRRAVNRHLTRQ